MTPCFRDMQGNSDLRTTQHVRGTARFRTLIGCLTEIACCEVRLECYVLLRLAAELDFGLLSYFSMSLSPSTVPRIRETQFEAVVSVGW